MTQREGKGQGSGVFITFEGGDGAGKTTHLNFLARSLTHLGCDVLCLREPGGTSISECLRDVVLDKDHVEMCDQTELLIYEAARAQLVREVIIPALQQGKVVLCDRFYDSTVAYQAYGRALPLAFVNTANNFACQGVHPCRTILLTAGETTAAAANGLERATKHGEADRLEQAGLSFHERVFAGFQKIAQENPERIRVISSALPKPETARAIFSELSDIFGWDDIDKVFPEGFFDQILEVNTDKKATIAQPEPKREGER